MVVQQPQVQQVQQVQPQVQQQTAVPTAQASQIVGSGVQVRAFGTQVRAFGAKGFCRHWQVHVHLCMELDFRHSTVRVLVVWIMGSLGASPQGLQGGQPGLVLPDSPHLSSDTLHLPPSLLL